MSMWTKMKLAGAPEEDVDDQLCASTAHPSASASEEEPMCNQENIRVDAQTERKQHDQVDNSHSFSPSAAANTSRAGPLALAQSAARGERLAVPLLHRVSVDDIQACLQSWSLQSEPVRIKGNPFVGADGVKLGRGLGLGGLGQPPLQQRPDRYAKIAQQPGAATTSYSLESLGTGASEAIQLCDHVKLDAEQQQAISFPAREKEMNVNAGRTSKLSESNLNLFDDENAKQWEQELTSTPGASPSMKMRPMSVRSPPDVAQMQESHSKGRFTSGAHRERDSILELSVDSWVMDDGECSGRGGGAPWPPIPPLSPWDHDAGAGAIPAAAEEPRGPRMALHETEEAFAVQSEPEDPTSARAADTREVAISANHAPAAAEEAVEKLKMEAGKRVFPLRADALMGTSSASSSWQADDTSSSRSRSGSAAVIDDLKSGVNSLLFPEQNYTRVETPIATSSPGLKMAGSSGKTKTAKTLSRCAADGALAIAPENKSGERTRIMVVANITEEDHCPTGAEAVGADNKARQAVEPEVEQERVEEKKPARIISAPKEREDPFRLAETSSVYKTYLIYKQQLAQIRSQIRF
eukprot:g9974.t1